MSERIRILHVVFSLDPGGMENGLVNVARQLPADEFDVHVCCLERRGAFADRLPNPEQVYVLDKPPGKSLRTAWHLRQLNKRLRPHLLHSHNLGPMIYAVLSTAWGRSVPVFQGEHGMLPDYEQAPRRLAQRRRYYRACCGIHTVSVDLKTHLVDLGFPGEAIIPIVNGVDASRFQPGDPLAARQQLGLPATGFVIGIVGRLVASKQHRMLFDAVASLAERLPDLHVAVVGDGGDDQDAIRAAAQASRIAERIHMLGFRDDTVPCYQAMDLLAVPSSVEGLSNAVLEAMACGVPVLSNEVCGSREVIRSGVDGFLAPMATVGELAGAIEKAALDRGLLSTIGGEARQTALKQFSLEAMVAVYADAYRRHAEPTAMSTHSLAR